MKKFLYSKTLFLSIVFFFLFLGCSPYWESPSSKLASQADNLIENKRIDFFESACSILNTATQCIEADSQREDLCLRNEDKWAKNASAMDHDLRRFLTPNQYSRLVDIIRPYKDLYWRKPSKKAIIALFLKKLEFFSEIYPKCREI